MRRRRPEQIEQAAETIYDFLQDNGLFDGVTIYYNGGRLMSGDAYWQYVLHGDEAQSDVSWEERVWQRCEMEDYIPEADGDVVIGMTCEGDFCEAMCYGTRPEIRRDFEQLAASLGLALCPAGVTALLLR